MTVISVFSYGYGALSDRPRKSYITLIYITVIPLKYVSSFDKSWFMMC